MQTGTPVPDLFPVRVPGSEIPENPISTTGPVPCIYLCGYANCECFTEISAQR
jgi:hypothetical protein